MRHLLLFSLACLIGLSGCNNDSEQRLTVQVSAYTSHVNQTQGDPFLAAWNNRLKPGMKAIAVSRDLLKLGLTNGVKVKIEGLPGTYVVKDKMNARFTRKIDIYMGVDIEAARNWGLQEREISWVLADE